MAYRQMDTKAPAYLEDFLEQIEVLPTQIRGKFAEMREMDDRAVSFMADADKVVAEVLRKAAGKAPSTEALKKAYQEVISLQGKAVASAGQKVEVAEQAFQIVDDVIRNIDDNLREFEAQLRKDGRWPSGDKPPRQSSVASAAAGSSASAAPGTPSATRKASNTAASSSTHKTRSSGTSSRGGTQASGRGGSTKAQKEEDKPVPMSDEPPVDPNEPKFCYCEQISYGEMVACDNDDCERKWFHFPCVGLTKAPEGNWLCRECEKIKRRH